MFLLLSSLMAIAVLLAGAYLFWTVRFKKASRNELPVLVYHKIGNRFEWGITRQKIRQFEQQIRYLKQQGYRSIKMDESFDQKGPEDSKRILITFDDGYESVYSFAFPLLKRYGFCACIFLITGYVGRYNKWDVNWGKKFRHIGWAQIREMMEYGFTFGSHTVNHPDLTRLEKRYLEYELKSSKEELEDKLGREIRFLSFPFGKYNQMVERVSQEVGYQKAFTVCSSSKERNSHPFVKGRVGMHLFDSPLTLRIKLDRGRLFWIEDLKGRIINTFARGTTLVKKPDYKGIESRSPAVPPQFSI